jgi:WD40-like Beta Propeller Repeat
MVKLKQWLALIAILAGIAATAALAPIHAAPPGASVPPGKIYFTWDTEVTQDGHQPLGFWSMNADGSGKQLVPYAPTLYRDAQLSHLLHQGHRWFLEFRTGGLFAVRDDGDFVQPLVDTTGYNTGHFRWSQDDSLISIAARPSQPDAVAHIYAAFLTFNPDTGLPELDTPLVEVADGEQAGYNDIRNHDWSPYGDEIVYQLTGNPGPTSAMIVDLVTGTSRLLAANGWTPVWSPDGTRIAYRVNNDGIYVSNPDGTARLKLTKSSYDSTAGWSPDGKHVLFNRLVIRNRKNVYYYDSDVMRIPATGGTAVNLTKDIDGTAWAKYWR